MTDRLKVLASSYLDHIKIAVEAGDRGAPFRDFFDNWNAFRSEADHHRSRGERPRWFNNPSALSRMKMLEALDFQSTGAAQIMKHTQDDPKLYRQQFEARDLNFKLIVDHAVPLSVMVTMLFDPLSGEEIELSRSGIEAHLLRWYRLGVISHAENAQLNQAGLSSKMPSNWDRKDPFARYSAIGLVSIAQEQMKDGAELKVF